MKRQVKRVCQQGRSGAARAAAAGLPAAAARSAAGRPRLTPPAAPAKPRPKGRQLGHSRCDARDRQPLPGPIRRARLRPRTPSPQLRASDASEPRGRLAPPPRRAAPPPVSHGTPHTAADRSLAMFGPADPRRARERAELKQQVKKLLGVVKVADPVLFKNMAGPYSLAGAGVGAGAGARGSRRARGARASHGTFPPPAGVRCADHLQRPLQRGGPQDSDPVAHAPGRSGQRAAGAGVRRAAMPRLRSRRCRALDRTQRDAAIGASVSLLDRPPSRGTRAVAAEARARPVPASQAILGSIAQKKAFSACGAPVIR
jgi:hypothetical protein